MLISLSNHLRLRLRTRKINAALPKRIIENAEQICFDVETNHFIAIKQERYAGKKRPMVAVFDRSENEVKIITVYPSDEQEILARTARGRWIHEKSQN